MSPVVYRRISILDPSEASQSMSEFVANLPGSAKSSLARALGVSLRTVERWSSESVQFRNYIPRIYWNFDLGALPVPVLYRVFVADAVINGFTAFVYGGGQTGQYLAGTGSLATAIRLAELFRFSLTGDPFRDNATTGIEIEQVGNRWRVVIEYTTNYNAETGDWGDREWNDDWDDYAGDLGF